MAQSGQSISLDGGKRVEPTGLVFSANGAATEESPKASNLWGPGISPKINVKESVDYKDSGSQFSPRLWPNTRSPRAKSSPSKIETATEALDKFYAQMADEGYDLTLKDIVVPQSLSSDTKDSKATNKQSTSKDGKQGKGGKNHQASRSPRKSVPFPGEIPVESPRQSHSGDSIPLTRRRDSVEGSPTSTTKSGFCAKCSSSVLVFRTRCLVCGKVYCNSCVKDAMGNMPEGRKCKNTCLGRPFNKRYTSKVGKGCWPFGISSDVKEAERQYARRSRYSRK